jgi:hypothetical protein
MKILQIVRRTTRTIAGSFFLGLGSSLLGVPNETFDEWMKMALLHDVVSAP